MNKLKLLGLTKQEIAIYNILSAGENLTAREIATKMRIFPNAVYRACKNLRESGFIRNSQAYPLSYRAIDINTAVPIQAAQKIQELQKLSAEYKKSPLPQKVDNPTDVNLIYGSEKVYEEGARLLTQTEEEMLVISIGEPVTPNLLLAVNDANKRGVAVKMIVHKYDEENRDIVENLKKNGYEIRFFPGWGFHMAIYDAKKTLLIINNPEKIEERAAMLLNSPGLSQALRDYFYSIWKMAKKV